MGQAKLYKAQVKHIAVIQSMHDLHCACVSYFQN